jgi:uncharacterized protein (TIGR02594 family)
MRVALAEVGAQELPGRRRNNPRVMEYLGVVGLSSWDETPWCSAFANWCFARVGLGGSGRAQARSWLGWGKELPLERPRFGCVTVVQRTAHPRRGHVGFWVGARGGEALLLGGNQDDRVCVKGYPLGKVLGHRWPASEGTPWG